MKIKCVITDDEPIARKGLRGYIEKTDFLTLAGECENALQLNELLQKEQPELLFMDIEMPYINGIDFLSGIRNPPKVIITSAYEQYALKGYELNVTDYLLKPISFDRFLKAVNRVHELLQKEQESTPEPYLFVKTDKLLKKVTIQDILFIESMGNYVLIHTSSSKEITYSPLKSLLEFLPGNQFMQVHRSYIVQTSKVQAIEGNMLIIGTHKIPIARNLRDEVLNALLKDKLISR
ncbi:LytTR family DNA-binding domain-containing protein [Bacteroides sp. Marseille-P8574]|uniref:LytR/AlgR family response regulator transcription factor n=1 Tax=Bacteroides sp. Marseille-P8574 TaxID=2697504 RepID=UPI00157E140C|nr:LytTR family DNA-binding domain-containing protein [Bacteroides sp. Marseille-P8574]